MTRWDWVQLGALINVAIIVVALLVGMARKDDDEDD